MQALGEFETLALAQWSLCWDSTKVDTALQTSCHPDNKQAPDASTGSVGSLPIVVNLYPRRLFPMALADNVYIVSHNPVGKEGPNALIPSS